MQNKNSQQIYFQHKYNNRIIGCILSIYSSIQIDIKSKT